MKIKSVIIKNIRGFQDRVINLDMIPNKPSLLVAPNGAGKTSFATAFDAVRPKSFKVDPDEIYQDVKVNEPSISIETDQGSFVNDKNHKQISEKFSVFVINSRNKPHTIKQTINGHTTAISKMRVSPIYLVRNIPSDVEIPDTFVNDYGLEKVTRGVIPSISKIVKNSSFWRSLNLDELSVGKRNMKVIEDFLQKIAMNTSPKKNVYDKIHQEDSPALKAIGELNHVVGILNEIYPGIYQEVETYIIAIRLIILSKKHKALLRKKQEYAQKKLEMDSYDGLFDTLKRTWKDIKPKKVDNDYIIEIPDTSKLSNGERDIIVFMAMLQQARNALKKDVNILIIDEIFDYLDDANMVAAQYYITLFIKEIKNNGRQIFPIILSHLNPGYYKAFAFQDMKVYYLDSHKPLYSPKMEKLLRRRSVLEKQDKDDGTQKDLISKYLLHFHWDDSVDMTECYNGEPELGTWKQIPVFKNYCQDETRKYINHEDYDSIAVCVWLRECIEKNLYERLSEEKRELFLDTHSTKKKIAFALECGVHCNEVCGLLGLIYNDNLHLKDSKTNEDSREILFSRLENETIRSMIQSIVVI